MPGEDRRISFGPYTLHPTIRSLTLEGEPVAIGSRALDLLIALVDRRGELVSKKALLAIVWPEVSIEENNLKVHIMALRRALKDDGRTYVVTVPGRGYSFVAPIRFDASEEPAGEVSYGGRSADEQAAAAHHAARPRPFYRIGVLHSLSGPLALSEGAIVDATLLAVDQINARGGIRGRKIEPTIVDCQSDEATFAREAERLIVKEGVCALFGGFTSACRKEILPVVEHHDHLLLFPMQYEGLEQSPNIFYLGAAPNQQIIPAVRWAFAFLRCKRFFLIGWNSIYPRATNAIVRDEVLSLGGEIVGEEYVQGSGMSTAARKIAEVRPDIILNSLTRDLNAIYCSCLRDEGVTSEASPTIYFSISENEVQSLASRDMIGDYVAWNYFQSLDRPANQQFVKLFRSHYGLRRVTSDPLEAAYSGVHLWAQAAEQANSDHVGAIRHVLPNQHFRAPGGDIRIDPENHHTWKIMRLARIGDAGQFSIVWSSERSIRPEPYPASRSIGEWHAFLQDLRERWGGRWTGTESRAHSEGAE
jgi:urea transport system substrate-binding protein